MKYVATENVCEYKIGDEVPVEKAVVWEKMYKFPPVKKVNDGEEVKAPEPKPEAKPEPEVKPEEPKGSDYGDELLSIKGIGASTVADIVKVYSTRESLVEAVASEEKLPFRDDVARLLNKHFAK